MRAGKSRWIGTGRGEDKQGCRYNKGGGKGQSSGGGPNSSRSNEGEGGTGARREMGGEAAEGACSPWLPFSSWPTLHNLMSPSLPPVTIIIPSLVCTGAETIARMLARGPGLGGDKAEVPFVSPCDQYPLLWHVNHGVASSLGQVERRDAAVGGRAEKIPYPHGSGAAMASRDYEAPAANERHVLVDAAKSRVVGHSDESSGGVEANFADGRTGQRRYGCEGLRSAEAPEEKGPVGATGDEEGKGGMSGNGGGAGRMRHLAASLDARMYHFDRSRDSIPQDAQRALYHVHGGCDALVHLADAPVLPRLELVLLDELGAGDGEHSRMTGVVSSQADSPQRFSPRDVQDLPRSEPCGGVLVERDGQRGSKQGAGDLSELKAPTLLLPEL
eukprot:747066-Hanusia_phi.AAC.1